MTNSLVRFKWGHFLYFRGSQTNCVKKRVGAAVLVSLAFPPREWHSTRRASAHKWTREGLWVITGYFAFPANNFLRWVWV